MKYEHELKVLVASRALISIPERWTKGTFSRDAEGNKVEIDDEAATCWCGEGAVHKARLMINTYEFQSDDVFNLLWKARKNKNNNDHFYGFAAFNDTHTHEEALAVFDDAIELAKQELEALNYANKKKKLYLRTANDRLLFC